MSSFFDKLVSEGNKFHVAYSAETILFDTPDHALEKNGMFLVGCGYLNARRRIERTVYTLVDIQNFRTATDMNEILAETSKIGYPLDLRVQHPVYAHYILRSSWLENFITENDEPHRFFYLNTILVGKNHGKTFIVNCHNNDEQKNIPEECNGVWTLPEYIDMYLLAASNWENCAFLNNTEARHANEICPGIARVDELQGIFDSDSEEYSDESPEND